MPNRNSGNRSIQSLQVMTDNIRKETEERSHGTRTLSVNNYKALSADVKDESLTTDIQFRISQLSGKRNTVDLHNVDDLRQRTIDYLSACSTASVIPTMQGLCVHGYGYSRQHVYKTMSSSAGTPESRFFETISDMFADILSNQGLKGNANSILSIFLMKNNHGFSDTYRLEPIDNSRHEPTSDELIDESLQLMSECHDYNCNDDSDIAPDGLPW